MSSRSSPSPPTATTPLLSPSPDKGGRSAFGGGRHPGRKRTMRATVRHVVALWAGLSEYVVGVVMLLLVVSLWVTSSFITSDLFADGYNKPFLVTYLNTASFALYLLPPFYRRLYPTAASRARPSASTHDHQRVRSSRSRSPLATLHPPLTSAAFTGARATDRLTTRETAELALLFCGAWFAANWSLNKALEWTSVGSSTILASMSGFFTLAIGRIFNVESFTPAKLLAVSVSFLGVLLVSSADSFSPTTALATALDVDIPHPYRLTGDLLSLLSALFYSIYLILLKVRIGDERRIDMQLFFGFVGLFNIVALWPVGVALHVAGWETFDWPRGGAVWAVLVGNMFITLVSDYLYVKAMLKTTPLVVTIGLSLTIPFAISLDLVRGTSTGGVQSLLGAGLVLASFGFMGVEGAKEDETGLGLLADEDEDGASDVDLERGRPRSRRSSGGSSGASARGGEVAAPGL